MKPARWMIRIGVLALATAGAIYVIRVQIAGGPHPIQTTGIAHIHGLAIQPANPDVLWIGTHSGLFRVVRGRQWVHVGGQQYDMMGLVAHPTRTGVLFTSGHPGTGDRGPDPLGVEISRNGGKSWQPLALAAQADFHALTISRADPAVLYAWSVLGRTGLYRSQDGGQRWDYLGDRGLGPVYALAAHPTQAAVVFAGTARGLYRSVDSGRTWRPVTPALSGIIVTAVEISSTNTRVMYAYAVTPALGLIRSDDGGQRWAPVGFYLAGGDTVSNLLLDPRSPDVLYLATDSGDLYRSMDGGKTRQRLLVRGEIVAP